MHFLVSEFCFAEDFRFQLELDKLLDPLSLNQHLGSLFVNRDTKLVLLPEKNRVFFGTEFESKLIEESAQLRDLRRRESVGVGVHQLRWRGTPNAERRPHKVQLPNFVAELSRRGMIQISCFNAGPSMFKVRAFFPS